MPSVGTYECLLVVDGEGGSKAVEAARQKVESVLGKGGGEVALWDMWGERRLAYPIKKRVRGNYALAYIHGSNEAREELARSLKLTEEVLRFIIVKPFEEPDLAALAAKQEAKAARAEAEGAPAPAPAPETEAEKAEESAESEETEA